MSAVFRRWGRSTCTTGFETLLAPHIEHLSHLAYRFTGSGAAAEDLVQDVLVKSYAQWETIRHYERLDVWLARVLYNEYIDGWRRARLQPHCWSALSDADLERFNAFPDPRCLADPLRMAADQQLRLRLIEGLGHLSPEQRAILLFHDVEEYTLQECATIFSKPIGTCKSRIFRARSKLREYLGHDLCYWVEEDPSRSMG
ncbi:MAG: RNA polymerase sigma factor [Gammaproteobacteria bacterium]